jgi:5-methylcytosine-specific restriction endonuclease McrA
MAWVYLDDHFDEHHKVLGAGELHPLAPWLFVCGLTYSRRSANGGLIPAPKVRTLTPLYKKAARDALVVVALWDEVGDGAIEIHDYQDWNRTNEERSASARNAAQVRWKKEKKTQESTLTRGQRMKEARRLGTHTNQEWAEMLTACGTRCLRCRREYDGIEVRLVKDHILPVYQGGSDAIGNLQPLCAECNSQKGPEAKDFRPAGAWRR